MNITSLDIQRARKALQSREFQDVFTEDLLDELEMYQSLPLEERTSLSLRSTLSPEGYYAVQKVNRKRSH